MPEFKAARKRRHDRESRRNHRREHREADHRKASPSALCPIPRKRKDRVRRRLLPGERIPLPPEIRFRGFAREHRAVCREHKEQRAKRNKSDAHHRPRHIGHVRNHQHAFREQRRRDQAQSDKDEREHANGDDRDPCKRQNQKRHHDQINKNRAERARKGRSFSPGIPAGRILLCNIRRIAELARGFLLGIPIRGFAREVLLVIGKDILRVLDAARIETLF